MGDAARIVVDADELERVTAEVVREVPAHLVAAEVRRRMAASAKRRPNPAIDEYVRRAKEKMRG